MFKATILRALYGLSDEQVKRHMLDRLSFTRFPGLGLETGFPTQERYGSAGDKLARADVIELFGNFDDYPGRRGYKATGEWR